MNYIKIYKNLIRKGKKRLTDEYTEVHHIVPRCVGGSNKKYNLVRLTPEEHYLAHLLLVKIMPDNNSLVYAAKFLTVSSRCTVRNNKEYGWLKRKYQLICKQRIGNKNNSFGKKWYYNPETLEVKKINPNEVNQGWIKGRGKSKNNQNNQQKTSIDKTKEKCKYCGNIKCQYPKICNNHQRIKSFINYFNFNIEMLGSNNFYDEYNRIVNKLDFEYNIEKLSVEELRIKYNIRLNETMRCILRSLNINRRDLSSALKNYCSKPG